MRVSLAFLLASWASVAISKPLTSTLQQKVQQAKSKLAETRQIGLEPVSDCSQECTFECMLENSCTLQEFCNNEYGLLISILGWAFNCTGEPSNDFFIELNLGGVVCYDSLDAEDPVSSDTYDSINGYCAEFVFRDTFLGGILQTSGSELRLTEPPAKAGTFSTLRALVECATSDYSIDYGNASYCPEGCWEELFVNNATCIIDDCLDCGNGTTTINCSNVDPTLVETSCDEESELDTADLIRYFQSIHVVDTEEPLQESIGENVTALVFSTVGSEMTDTELGVWSADGTLLASNDDRSADAWSEVIIHNFTLPAVYYVGGSDFFTSFSDGFNMTGSALEFSEIANITFSLNGVTIGTKRLGDVASTGLSEFALFRVEIGVMGTIVASEDVSIAPPTRVATLVFTTEGSSITDTEMAVWDADGNLLDEDDDSGYGALSRTTIEAVVPAVYYVGGSEYATAFGSNFEMSGEGLELGETGTITFVVNDEVIGTKLLGDQLSTGLPEYALFRVEIGGNSRILSVEDATSSSMSSALFFSTATTQLSLVEIGVWDKNGTLISDGENDVLIGNPDLPAVFYVGGSETVTSFFDGFVMTGPALEPFETGNISFSLNNELIGSKEVGDSETTGLTEFALFRVEVGNNSEIISAQDVSESPPPSTTLVFSTEGSTILDTEMAVWNENGTLLFENDQREEDALSEVVIRALSLPAVYYVGGSEFITYFYDNLFMDGPALEADETGNISFSVNGIPIGTRLLGDAITTGLPEFALLRVEIGNDTEILSVEDLSLSLPQPTVLTFSTNGSEISDTELGVWDKNGILIQSDDDGGIGSYSQVVIEAPTLPAIYYVGGSAFGTSFFSGFRMDGSALESGTTANITFSMNGELIGTKRLGDAATTGLPEYALFRVEIGNDTEILSVEDVDLSTLTLTFSSASKTIINTNVGVWEENGLLLDTGNSQVVINTPELPAVLYVGGSEEFTVFENNFTMFGSAMESDETGAITFSLNGATIGTKKIGDAATTGLPEYALFRVEINNITEIVSVQDLSVPPLVFSTDGSGIRDTEMGLWLENGTLLEQDDDSGKDLWSQVTLLAPSLPAVYYMGGSKFATSFSDDFEMTSEALAPGETGSIHFSVNGVSIGSKLLGDANTTGLSEFSLYRVEIDIKGKVESVVDVSQGVKPLDCSLGDYLASVDGCSFGNMCDLMENQLPAETFNCVLNASGGFTIERRNSANCYDDLSQIEGGNSFSIEDLTIIPEGMYCESTSETDSFDMAGTHVSSRVVSVIRLTGNRMHSFVLEHTPISCSDENAFEFLTLGNETYCYALDNCSSITLDGQACSGTCAECDVDGMHADCSNIDASLVQSCGETTLLAKLFPYLDGLEVINATTEPSNT